MASAAGKEDMMKTVAASLALVVVTVVAVAVLMSLGLRGCVNANQNQNNSPISISKPQGRPALSVTCSADGSIAYATDGRNVYRYEHDPAGGAGTWRCILSQGERLALAIRHDPNEAPDRQEPAKGN